MALMVQDTLVAGLEQLGSMHVLIVSQTAFNLTRKLPIICPITIGGAFFKRNGFPVSIRGAQSIGLVRRDQPRVLEFAARHGRKFESLPAEFTDEVLARLYPLFTN